MLEEVTTHSSRQGNTMGKCKTKANQVDLGMFMHIPYSDIFKHIRELFRPIQNPM